MNERRKEYNQAQAEIRRAERDRIRAFRVANPERFAELLAQVQSEEVSTSGRRMTLKESISDRQSQAAMKRIDELIMRYRAGRKDYHVMAKDQWGDERHLLLLLPKEPAPGDKIRTPIKGTEYTVTEAWPCTCPLCQ